jgi:hypothetical protein
MTKANHQPTAAKVGEPIPPVKHSGFLADASPSLNAVDARLAGNADSLVLPELESFLALLHTEACRLGAGEVRLDVRELYFMNSSCMKLFVNWFTLLRELDQKKQYRVVIRSSPKLHWQARSFDALCYIANGLVTVS